MKKNGFTLAELLGVMVILSIISIITVPAVTNSLNSYKTKLCNSQINEIISAAKTWATENVFKLPDKEGESYTINLKTLAEAGYVDAKINNPVTNENFDLENTIVTITKNGKGFTYEMNDDTINTCYSNGVKKPASKPKPESFSTDSWETIINAVKKNNTSKYHVGDTKEVDMGEFGKHTVRIANMSTPSECLTEGFSQTACGFVLEFSDIITFHNMNNTKTNLGGWPATSMREYVNNDIYNILPSDLKDGIIDTFVVSGHGSNDSSDFTTIDKLYLLANKEVWGKEKSSFIYDTADEKTRQFDYYSNLGVTKDNYSAVIKKSKASMVDINDWWLRSPYSTSECAFCVSNGSGKMYGSCDTTNTFGVSPAFRIG